MKKYLIVIENILKMAEDDLTKALLIAQNKKLNDDFVFDYLEEKHDVVLTYYIELQDPNNHLIPSPKSTSEWSEFELDYKINIVESDEKKMFGSEDAFLSPHTKEFLETHTDDFVKQYKTLLKTPNFNKFSDFASAIIEYKDNITNEGILDDVLSEFLKSVREKDFYVKRQVPLILKVGNFEKDAISDISLKDMKLNCDGVVVVEYKTTKNVLKKSKLN